MGTKTKPSTYDCYANLEPDEPYFVLTGRDPSAAIIVRMWAHSRETLIRQGKKPRSDKAMIEEARTVALAMEKFAEEWKARKAKPQ